MVGRRHPCSSLAHTHIERLFFALADNVLHSLPNTMDDATPMKPKKAAEEGQVSMLKSLMVAGWVLSNERKRKRRRAV